MKAGLALPLLIAVSALAGCASSVRVVYQSDPPGATIYENGRPWGQTPVTLTYKREQSSGCWRIQQMSAKWASGATAVMDDPMLCSERGEWQSYTFVRPDVPGREIDTNHAIQLEQTRLMRAQTAAQLYQAMPPPQIRPIYTPPPRQTSCTSYRVGNTVQTDCR